MAKNIFETERNPNALIYFNTIGKYNNLLLISTSTIRPEHILMNISEPVKVIGEGLYNLNNLKEIVATEMDQKSTQCQNEEAHVCTTTKYVNT